MATGRRGDRKRQAGRYANMTMSTGSPALAKGLGTEPIENRIEAQRTHD